ncbi:MAG: FAD:protein FMN transferase [Planctomycetes bacterium]|nr:FAD:protein FMN transferase [Planctomycetota bacterium]
MWQRPSHFHAVARALLLSLGLLLGLCGCANTSQQRFDFTRVVMGVQARISLYAPSESSAERAAANAFALLAQIEEETSDYRVDNSVARLATRAGTQQWTPIGPHLTQVLEHSLRLTSESAGVFDPTMGPLTHLWRSQRQSPGTIVSDTDIANAIHLVNWKHIEISGDQVRLLTKGMKVDFGAIAKGYAAECAVRELSRHCVPRSLVSIAGDVFAGSPPPGSKGWHVAVQAGQSPTADSQIADAWIELSDAGCSTSGDVEQVITVGGRRQSHIIDIRTGRGSDRRRSVTVIAPTGWQSDALATILYLIDDAQAQRILDRHPGTRAIIFDRIESNGQVQLRKREIKSAAVRMSETR